MIIDSGSELITHLCSNSLVFINNKVKSILFFISSFSFLFEVGSVINKSLLLILNVLLGLVSQFQSLSFFIKGKFEVFSELDLVLLSLSSINSKSNHLSFRFDLPLSSIKSSSNLIFLKKLSTCSKTSLKSVKHSINLLVKITLKVTGINCRSESFMFEFSSAIINVSTIRTTMSTTSDAVLVVIHVGLFFNAFR